MQKLQHGIFRMLFFRLIILLTAFASNSLYAQHGIDPHWSAQVPITKSSANVSADGAVANNMVVQNDGTTLLFYTETSGSKRTPYYVGTRDNGTTWNAPAPTIFAPPTRTTGFGSVSVDSDSEGNIHTIWGARAPAAIFYARWDAKTQQWSDTVRLSSQIKQKAGFCNVTTDRKGRVHVFWMDGENGTTQISEVMYVRSENTGKTWSQQVMISKDDGKHSAFPIADYSGATGDNLAIAWRDSAGRGSGGSQNWDLHISTTSDGGKTWSEPRVLIGNADYESDPNLIVGKDGRMYIAFHIYQAANPFNARVMYGYSNDGGKTWLPEGFQQISETNIRSHLVKEAYDFMNDRPWFFWKDERDLSPTSGGTMPSGDGRGADIICSYISQQGKTVSKPEFLTDAGMDEVGLHNFKIGADGLPRAHYFIKQNDLTTLYYTQRKGVSTGLNGVTRNVSNSGIQLIVAPNPVLDILSVRISLTKPEHITLTVYNALGQNLIQLLDAELPAGERLLHLTVPNMIQGAQTIFLQARTGSGLITTIPVQVMQ